MQFETCPAKSTKPDSCSWQFFPSGGFSPNICNCKYQNFPCIFFLKISPKSSEHKIFCFVSISFWPFPCSFWGGQITIIDLTWRFIPQYLHRNGQYLTDSCLITNGKLIRTLVKTYKSYLGSMQEKLKPMKNNPS